jgi:hypothetical protein
MSTELVFTVIDQINALTKNAQRCGYSIHHFEVPNSAPYNVVLCYHVNGCYSTIFTILTKCELNIRCIA